MYSSVWSKCHHSKTTLPISSQVWMTQWISHIGCVWKWCILSVYPPNATLNRKIWENHDTTYGFDHILTIFSDKPQKFQNWDGSKIVKNLWNSHLGEPKKPSWGPHFLDRDPGRTPDRSSSPETAGWRKSNLKSSALANLQCFMLKDGNHMVLVCV
jgi:hypothetical protein